MNIPPIIIFGILLLMLDVPFISTVMAPKYASIGLRLQSPLYALIAYLAMALAWYLIQGDVKKGALVGLVVFGTYAFTLLAVLPQYKLSIGLTEVAWGTILYTVATLLTNKVLAVL